MLRSKKCEQRNVREILLRINETAGVPALDEGGLSSASIVDGGLGIYVITFATAFSRIPVVVATAVNAAAIIVTLSAVSTTGCTIKVWNTVDPGVAIDSDVHVMISGFDAADQT